MILPAVLFLVLDATYLFFQKTFYELQIAQVQRVSLQFRPSGAILCYFVLLFVLYYFLLLPRKSSQDAFLLGFSIYAIYNLTNYATLKQWNAVTVLVDSLWGGVLFGTTVFISRKYLMR